MRNVPKQRYIPPEDPAKYFAKNGNVLKQYWGTIKLKPSQVFCDPQTEFNILEINRGPAITVITGKTNQAEYLDIKQLTGRFLKFCHAIRNLNHTNPAKTTASSQKFYDEWIKSGFRMSKYIEQMPGMQI